MKRARLCVIGVLAGAVYGVILFFAAAILSGGGEGFTVAFAVFGSPFSATPAYLLFPAPWMILGSLLAMGYTAPARLWLLIHTTAIPLAIRRDLAPRGVTLDAWIQEAMRHPGISPTTVAMWSLYAIGYLGAWWLAWRRAFPGAGRYDS